MGAKAQAAVPRGSESASGCAARKWECKRLCRAQAKVQAAAPRKLLIRKRAPPHVESGCVARECKRLFRVQLLVGISRFLFLDSMLRVLRACMRSGECTVVRFQLFQKEKARFTDEEFSTPLNKGRRACTGGEMRRACFWETHVNTRRNAGGDARRKTRTTGIRATPRPGAPAFSFSIAKKRFFAR